MKNLIRLPFMIVIACCITLVIGMPGIPGLANPQVAHASTAMNLYFAMERHSYSVYQKSLSDASESQVIFQSDSWGEPTAIAVDEENGYIYYAANQSTIYKMKQDTLAVVDTYSNEHRITYMSFDPVRNKLYFTETAAGTEPGTMITRIKVLDLADRSITTLYSTPENGLAFIFGLATDPDGGHMYFYKNDYDLMESGIYRMDISGAGLMRLVSNVGSVESIALDTSTDTMYYSDEQSIRVASLSTGEVQASAYYSGSDWITKIARDASTGTIYFSTNDSMTMTGRIYRVLSSSEAEQVVPNEGYVNDLVIAEAPLTYTMEPISDQTLTPLAAGYASGMQEAKSVTITRIGTGVLANVQASLSGANASAFVLTQPASQIDGTGSTFTVKAKDELSAGTYTATVTITADHMEPVSFDVTQVVHSYTIAPISDQTLTELVAGYASGTQEAKSVTITRIGTGVLANVQASLSGADATAFELTQPAGTIDGAGSTFTVMAKDELSAGTYTATVTITADHMEPVSFEVTQVVHSYTIAPISDQTLTPLAAGYASGTQETKSVVITRTGTGVLANVEASLSGTHASAFALTQPAGTIDGAGSTFTVKAKDELSAGTYTATVTITADHMEPVSFEVTQVVQPSAEARLNGLHITAGTLSPVFDPDVTTYRVDVPYATDSLTVVASTYDAKAAYAIYNGGAVVTGPAAELKVGDNRLEVKVTAEDGVSTQTYTIDVARAPSSNAAIHTLNLQGITLHETVTANVYQYTATVSNAVYATYVQAIPMDVHASISSMTVNGEPASNPIALSVGSNIIAVEIVAQDDVSRQTYTVTVTREASGNAQLGSLSINQGTMFPVFDPSSYAYHADVPYATEAVSVTASVYHDSARLKINGQLQGSGSLVWVPLKVGNNLVKVEVVAEDGIHSANYTLTIRRAASSNADLKGLTLSEGTLSPAFAADHLTYEATVPYTVSQVTVTASVYDPNAAIKVNGLLVVSGASTAPMELAVGTNTIVVEAIAQDGMSAKSYQISVTRSPQPSSPDPDPEEPAPEPDRGQSTSTSDNTEWDLGSRTGLFVNGMYMDQFAMITTTHEDGILFTVEADLLIAQLEQVKEQAVVRIAVDQIADKVSVALTGDVVKVMENQHAVLLIQTINGSYRLPAAQISIDQRSGQFGQAALADVVVHISIAKSDKDMVRMLDSVAKEMGLTVQAPPVDFAVTAAYRGATVEVDRFSSYVQREIPIPTAADVDGAMTAVVLEDDGQLRHVPTYRTVRDGKMVAVVHSMTNSTYALITNSITFADTEGHWSQAAVNDLASRLIVSGTEQHRFQPNAAITRAEFAAILARALGLPVDEQEALFQDVKPHDWYAGAVAAAKAYGLIQGYEDDTFRPAQTITREEAMVMISKAMHLTGVAMIAENAPEERLSTFSDGSQVQPWAEQAVASAIQYGLVSGMNGELRPSADITRAETASIIQRLLAKSGLIDE